MKRIEPIDPVANERGIVENLGLWPRTPENEFELDLEQFGDRQACHSQYRCRLES